MLRSNIFSFQESLLKLSRNRAEIPPKDSSHITTSQIYIVRNEAYEPYLAHAVNCASAIGVDLTLQYSNYDDTMKFVQIPKEANFVVLWLNWERITENAVALFFQSDSIVTELLADSRVHFVLPSKFGTIGKSSVKMELDNLGWPEDRRIFGINSVGLESRNIKLGYSREELDSISSKIGLQIASKDENIRIRALILDLDNTLYRGIYGETSDNERFLEPCHILLQSEIKKLRDSGILMCILSKNNLEDIQAIFESKLIPELKLSDFTIITGGWDSKSASLGKILEQLNFDEKFLAFVDDNKRELYEVGKTYPNMMCIDGSDPASVLKSFSTLLSFESSSTPHLIDKRNQDIHSAQARLSLKDSNKNPDSLLKELGTKIESFCATSVEEFDRANELFRKTNQFNLTLSRTILKITKVNPIKSGIILSSLSDTISDSGIIAAIYFTEFEKTIELREFVISCRALGRDVEKYILRSILDTSNFSLNDYHFITKFNFAEKNQPALKFVERFFIKKRDYFVLNSNKLIHETEKWYDEFRE